MTMFTASTTRRVGVFAAAAALCATAALAGAPASSANSFQTACNGHTSFGYNDGGDYFSVNSNRTGAWISASVKPISRPGPSFYISATAPRGGHASKAGTLMYAYEDTKYAYTVSCLSPSGNKIVKRGTFFS